MSTAQLRDVLRRHYGARRYRLTSDGEIHVYGKMPNSTQTGWYLFGYVGNAETNARIEQLLSS